MNYPLYKKVEVKKSNSSYGNWVVKYSEIHFRFFWKKAQADNWAQNYNHSINKVWFITTSEENN